MVRVEGGTFMMRNVHSSKVHIAPAHQVKLSSFHIGKFEVTQEEWQAVMGNNPSNFKGAKNPVEKVSWDDCQIFINKLNRMTGRSFRLPTEAEWEYAAQGGNKSQDYKYAGSNDVGSVAWYEKNSDFKTHSVGAKLPNELGIYDMTGNVDEWCMDWYYDDYVSETQINPNGPSSGSSRVHRGGCWISYSCCNTLRYRFHQSPDCRFDTIGFRLVLQ